MKIPFTDDELKLIENALLYVFDKKLDVIKDNRKLLSKEMIKSIVDSANPYADLADKVRILINQGEV